MNLVLQTTKFVVNNSRHVKIHQNKIQEFCENFKHEQIKHWSEAAPFDINSLSAEDRLNFLLISDALAFCYWGEPKWAIEYKGKQYDGWWGMIAALGIAMETNKP